MARQRITEKTLHKPAPKPVPRNPNDPASPVVPTQLEIWDDLVPGFGLRIASGGARTYFVMKRLRGKLVRRTVGKVPAGLEPVEARGELTLIQARKRARDMILQLESGIDPDARRAASQGSAKAPRTFGEVAAAYFKDPSKRGGGSLRSRGELERKVRVDLAEWQDRPIAEITRADVRAIINAKHATSPVSANRLLALVRRIFRWAVRDELISANPAMDIDPPAQEEERDRVLSLAEIARVWAAAEEMRYPYGPLVQLLILTAQRRSEVAGMRRDELDGNAWKLPDSRAKRGKGHLVPLSTRAAAILSALPRIGDGSLVFTTGKRAAKRGEKIDPHAPPAPVGAWSRMKDRLDWYIAANAAIDAGVEGLRGADGKWLKQSAGTRRDLVRRFGLQAWTLHDLRRSVATHLRDGEIMGSDRVDRLTVSKILNHAEGGMTRLYDRYSSDPEKRAALEAWALVIERLCGLNVVAMKGKRA